MFQNYALFPHMSVLDNVAYGPRRQGASRAEAAERAGGAGHGGPGRVRPALPARDVRRTAARALARAIVNRPKLLLLDEPLSALDLKLRKRMQLELKHLQARLGIAFVFVTHDQEEAMSMADRIVVMRAGAIEQAGAGADIYRRPASRFVAEFIGDANLIPYAVEAGGALRLQAQGLRVTRTAGDAPASGLALLRPEDLRLAQDGPGADCALSGTVRDVINVGSHCMIHVDVDGQTLVARHGGAAPAGLRAGDAATLAFAATDLHLIGGQS